MTETSLMTIFLVIGGLGFAFLVVSLIVGDIFDSLGSNFDGEAGILDSRVISVFLTAFGGFGAIGVSFGLGALTSSLFGIFGGVIFGTIVYFFGRFLANQHATSSVSVTDLVGKTAQVTVAIHPGKQGQISCRIGEDRLEKLARSADDQEISVGQIVKIESIAGDSVIVSAKVEDGYKLPSGTV
jgi:hypothetical protein